MHRPGAQTPPRAGPAADHHPTGPGERAESERPAQQRPDSALFGLPMMVLIFALVAVVKGIITEDRGFTIVGAVVAGGVFFAIGLAMTIAKRG